MLALAGVPAGKAVLATLAYRLFAYWLQLPAGLVGFILHRRRYPGDAAAAGARMSAARITYVGHATVLVEIGGTRLLTDPVLGARLLHIRRHAPPPAPEVIDRDRRGPDLAPAPRPPRLRLAAPARQADADHRPGRCRAHPAPPRLPGRDRARGGRDGERRRGRDHRDPGAPRGPAAEARAGGRRGRLCDRRRRAAPLLRRRHRPLRRDGGARGELDVAMLPIAGWGPRVGKGHLDPRSAARAAALLRPRIAIPIHWGTLLRIGLTARVEELLERPARRFVAELAAAAPRSRPACSSRGVARALAPPALPVALRPRGGLDDLDPGDRLAGAEQAYGVAAGLDRQQVEARRGTPVDVLELPEAGDRDLVEALRDVTVSSSWSPSATSISRGFPEPARIRSATSSPLGSETGARVIDSVVVGRLVDAASSGPGRGRSRRWRRSAGPASPGSVAAPPRRPD